MINQCKLSKKEALDLFICFLINTTTHKLQPNDVLSNNISTEENMFSMLTENEDQNKVTERINQAVCDRLWRGAHAALFTVHY